MFRIKICGITNRQDAVTAVAAGADAIGMNFYAASPRCCAADAADEISAAVPRDVCKVGVFVNATEAEIKAAAQRWSLDLVQLHGDEPVQLLRALRGIPVLRAFRVSGDLAPAEDYLRQCHESCCLPRMALVDASQPGQYGGTGKTLDWHALANQRARLHGIPLVLAGGLTPGNVAWAIDTVRPWAVDTASGVEAAPGCKSASLVQEFVAAAKAAFARQMALVKPRMPA